MLSHVALESENADLHLISPAAFGQALRLGDVGDVDADHRFAEPATTLATMSASLKYVVASTIARARTRRITRLEDAGADEHTVGAELHHQRSIGRGCDPAGGEQDDRKLARLRTLTHELEGARSSLASAMSSSVPSDCSSAGGPT